ncbi:MAG TPA: L-threonylcarbamoyladenylate synthase [Pseudacidobacterium sp.]|nr:L-threonylcarbamoyladenylate synthase [Pseudacidobacterium sp.]
MQTLRLHIDPDHLDAEDARIALSKAAEILRNGGTVAFPTETVYGLGANALDSGAVAKIFEAKQRPSWDPLIVHISDNTMLTKIVKNVPEVATQLIERFWPGPLTLLLEKSGEVPDAVTAGRPRVGVRMPQHPVAHGLIRAAGLPIAAPSANRFGRTSPTRAAHVLEDLDGRIDAILDAGETKHGLESTVIDVCESPSVIYRPGVISLEQVRAVGVDAVAFKAAKLHEIAPESLPSPGVGLRHYAPRATLVLIDGEGEEQVAAFSEAARRALHNGSHLGLMLPDTFSLQANLPNAIVFEWGRWGYPEELAQHLFAGLRYLDRAGVAVILCPMPPASGIGIAIRDRLRKAGMKRDGIGNMD